MKLARFLYQGKEGFGTVEDGKIVVTQNQPEICSGLLDTNFFSLSEVKLLPPVSPGKIVAVGLNYKMHSEEFGEAVPKEPKLFLKPPSAVIAHGEKIIRPQSERVDYEAELAVVIGKTCAKVPETEAEDYILGYTCFNDVTARDLQSIDGQWTRAKGFDTFAPIGPFIETDFKPAGQEIRLLLNGETKQKTNLNQMIFPVPFLISYISHVMTLMPGDVITTGTPSGVGPMQTGDQVCVSIDGVGELINTVL